MARLHEHLLSCCVYCKNPFDNGNADVARECYATSHGGAAERAWGVISACVSGELFLLVVCCVSFSCLRHTTGTRARNGKTAQVWAYVNLISALNVR